MKPDWDKLMQEYQNHESILVADVDCTAEGKDLCEKVGVEGFPTIKHGDPNNLEDYEGGRDLKALETFAKENLGPRCGPTNLELCDAETRKQIDEYMAMSDDAIDKLVAEKEAELKKAGADFEAMVDSLNKQYEEGQKSADQKKKDIKESGLGMMKAVLAQKKEKGEL